MFWFLISTPFNREIDSLIKFCLISHIGKIMVLPWQ